MQAIESSVRLFHSTENKFMTAQLIDGISLASQIRKHVAARAAQLLQHNIIPGLAVILVGEHPASQVYVRNKIKACADSGLHSVLENHPATISEIELLARIQSLNKNPLIHGILVQLPLPNHINAHRVIEAIALEKDVDGFHLASAGALMTGQAGFIPCTPYGVMRMLESTGINLRGAEAVVVGASNIVGKPQSMLLLQAGATVTICNSKTRDLDTHTKRADILVVATGKPKLIQGAAIKPGAVVIDVGINRLADGSLCGDVDFNSAREVAGWITPVPGGVGPMTIAMLLVNTLEATERSLSATNT